MMGDAELPTPSPTPSLPETPTPMETSPTDTPTTLSRSETPSSLSPSTTPNPPVLEQQQPVFPTTTTNTTTTIPKHFVPALRVPTHLPAVIEEPESNSRPATPLTKIPEPLKGKFIPINSSKLKMDRPEIEIIPSTIVGELKEEKSSLS